jgi:hypothetical protein
MLICTKCGNDNPLGRVFCGVCGGKLDLSRMTSEAVQESVKVNWFAVHWPKFAIGVGVIIVMIALLSLWPQSELIGEKGTPNAANKVTATLRVIGQLPAGRSTPAVFTEKDINAFFEYNKKDLKDVSSLTVEVNEGFVRVRMIRPLAKIALLDYALEPKISYDLVLIPFGGVLVPKQATMGHLSMFGPLRKIPVGKLYGLLSAEKEWSSFQYVTDIKVAKKGITLTCKR